MIAAAVVGGILMLGARNWRRWYGSSRRAAADRNGGSWHANASTHASHASRRRDKLIDVYLFSLTVFPGPQRPGRSGGRIRVLNGPEFSLLPLLVRQVLAFAAVVTGIVGGFWRYEGKSLWTWCGWRCVSVGCRIARSRGPAWVGLTPSAIPLAGVRHAAAGTTAACIGPIASVSQAGPRDRAMRQPTETHRHHTQVQSDLPS